MISLCSLLLVALITLVLAHEAALGIWKSSMKYQVVVGLWYNVSQVFLDFFKILDSLINLQNLQVSLLFPFKPVYICKLLPAPILSRQYKTDLVLHHPVLHSGLQDQSLSKVSVDDRQRARWTDFQSMLGCHSDMKTICTHTPAPNLELLVSLTEKVERKVKVHIKSPRSRFLPPSAHFTQRG